ncbi:hypothetical protein HYV85_04615 [Candidatus Woesearchaeota archaeon]|nr:hypothetical protein [Candidatus Woesearchaeota archaeon]
MGITQQELDLLTQWARQPRAGPNLTMPSRYSHDGAVSEDEMQAAELRKPAAREDRYDLDGMGGIESTVRRYRPNGASANGSKREAQEHFVKGTVGDVLFSAIFSGSKSSSVRRVHAYLTELARHQPDVRYSRSFSDSVLSALFQAKGSISREPSFAIQLRLSDRLEVIASVAFGQLNERPAFALFSNWRSSDAYFEEPPSDNGVSHRTKQSYVNQHPGRYAMMQPVGSNGHKQQPAYAGALPQPHDGMRQLLHSVKASPLPGIM